VNVDIRSLERLVKVVSEVAYEPVVSVEVSVWSMRKVDGEVVRAGEGFAVSKEA
jgi:hypothetical protein